MESNAWCPRLTAAMILSGSAVHVKGFGSALVSARKRLMASLEIDDGHAAQTGSWCHGALVVRILPRFGGAFLAHPPRSARLASRRSLHRASLGTQHSGCRFTYRPCS